MKCPLCKKANLVIGQDAILYFPIRGKKVITSKNEVSALDNYWLECTDCGKTSEDDETLYDLFKKEF